MQAYTVEELLDLPMSAEAVTAWALTFAEHPSLKYHSYFGWVANAISDTGTDSTTYTSRRAHERIEQWVLYLSEHAPGTVSLRTDPIMTFVSVANIPVTAYRVSSGIGQRLLDRVQRNEYSPKD